MVSNRRVPVAVKRDSILHLTRIDEALDALEPPASIAAAKFAPVRGVEVVTDRRIPIAVERDGSSLVCWTDEALDTLIAPAGTSAAKFGPIRGVEVVSY